MIVDTPNHRFQIVSEGSFGSEEIEVAPDVSLGPSNYQNFLGNSYNQQQFCLVFRFGIFTRAKLKWRSFV